MPQEIEMKFTVARLGPTRQILRARGARCLSAVIQDDLYFDTPSRRLLKAGCGLRLRTARPLRGGGRGQGGGLLTYKGPARRGGKAKVRREYEARVQAPQIMGEILACCGMGPMLRLQKRRWSYRLGRCAVELDELPLLGCFVEIEGPSQAAIESVRRKLKLAGRPLRSHYIRLAMGACKRAGRSCRQITFADCRRCSRQPH